MQQLGVCGSGYGESERWCVRGQHNGYLERSGKDDHPAPTRHPTLHTKLGSGMRKSTNWYSRVFSSSTNHRTLFSVSGSRQQRMTIDETRTRDTRQNATQHTHHTGGHTRDTTHETQRNQTEKNRLCRLCAPTYNTHMQTQTHMHTLSRI